MKMRHSHFLKSALLLAGLSLAACNQSGSEQTFEGAVNQPGIDKGAWKAYNYATSGVGESSDEFCEGELGEVIVIPDPEVPPDIPIELKIRSLKSTATQSTSSDPINLTGSALDQPVVADNVGFMGNGSYDDVYVKANNISQVGAMSANSINLEAQTIGIVGSLSSDNINILAHHLEEARSFSGTFCASVKSIKALHNLSSKLTVYGSYAGGTRATIDSISSMSAFVSLHDVDIGEIHSGSFRGRIENSSVESIRSASGEIYLVNSRIEHISNFSGTIHLIGGSSVGSYEKSSITFK